jgi:hypothetical protein
MKRLLLLLSIVFVFLVSISFAADSPLVEAAKKEKERRAQLKGPARVLTNQDIEKFKEKHPGTGGSNSQTQTSPTATEDQQQTEQPEKKEQKEIPLSDNEEYWRGRAEEIAKQISDLQQRADQLQSDVNALWMAGTAADNGQQTVLIGAQRGERMEELKQTQQQLEQAKQAQENLQEEARKEGALPGWVAPPQ